MNKEELENAFNETTDNAVKVINDYKELIVKYNIMKENAETLAKRIDRAIKGINDYEEVHGINRMFENEDLKIELLDILEGRNKE